MQDTQSRVALIGIIVQNPDPAAVISALSGKIGMLDGVAAKTVYSN